jgi:integrase
MPESLVKQIKAKYPDLPKILAISTQINALKKDSTDYTWACGEGLSILVQTNGKKLWRYRFLFKGKPGMISFGEYPKVTLKMARDQADECKGLLAKGINPSTMRKDERKSEKLAAASTFKVCFTAWFNEPKQLERAKKTRDTLQSRMDNDVFPVIGKIPVSAITAPNVREVIYRIKKRGALDVAERVLHAISRVMKWAVSHGLADRNPAADIDGQALIGKPAARHHAGLTEPKAVGELLRAIQGYTGTYTVSQALKLAPYLFLRPGELRALQWSDVDFDGAMIRVPASRMKIKDVHHFVPLAPQAVAILRDLHAVTGHKRLLFPSERGGDRCMSDAALGAALARLGYSSEVQTPHGFRTTASTLLHELQYPHLTIERQLAHMERGVSAAYNAAEYLPERIKMMTAYADYLDSLRDGGKVIPIGHAAA